MSEKILEGKYAEVYFDGETLQFRPVLIRKSTPDITIEEFEKLAEQILPIHSAAEIMYHDLIALGQSVPEEAARLFGKSNKT